MKPDEFPDWGDISDVTLNQTKLRICSEGRIEREGVGMLQVDFANKFIGGGVLGSGLVQEEIRFYICPEMITSMLFCERMDDNECIFITGSEQYSDYDGYSSSYMYTGAHQDETCLDSANRKCTKLVAMDATHFRKDKWQQFEMDSVRRELNKAYCAFYTTDQSPEGVATGNWGCGAFGGNPHLKALIQIMACAVTNRDICYFSFHDQNLMNDIHTLYTAFGSCSIGDVIHLISRYFHQVIRPHIASLQSMSSASYDSYDGDGSYESFFHFMMRQHDQQTRHPSSPLVVDNGENQQHSSSDKEP